MVKPEPPIAPEPSECCGSGCTPCVYDLYEMALERYQRDLATWQADLDNAAGAASAQGDVAPQ